MQLTPFRHNQHRRGGTLLSPFLHPDGGLFSFLPRLNLAHHPHPGAACLLFHCVPNWVGVRSLLEGPPSATLPELYLTQSLFRPNSSRLLCANKGHAQCGYLILPCLALARPIRLHQTGGKDALAAPPSLLRSLNWVAAHCATAGADASSHVRVCSFYDGRAHFLVHACLLHSQETQDDKGPLQFCFSSIAATFSPFAHV